MGSNMSPKVLSYIWILVAMSLVSGFLMLLIMEKYKSELYEQEIGKYIYQVKILNASIHPLLANLNQSLQRMEEKYSVLETYRENQSEKVSQQLTSIIAKLNDSKSEVINENHCDLKRLSSEPFLTGFLLKTPPIRILLHDPMDDVFVSRITWESRGNGNFFENAISYTLLSAMQQDENPFMLDIGANIGVHSLFIAGKGFDVAAFEPLPLNFNLLRCSRYLNDENIQRHLTVHNVALGETDGMICMEYENTNRGHAFSVTCSEQTVQVPLRTLDSYWEKEWNRRQVTVIKVDVEGFEPFVFKGSQKMLSEAPPKFIQMEFSKEFIENRKGNPRDIFELLLPLGYHVYENGDVTSKWEEWFQNEGGIGIRDISFKLITNTTDEF